MRSTFVGIVIVAAATHAFAQPPLVGAQFDVVSIKPTRDQSGSSMRILPDGSRIMTNITIG